MTELEFWKLSGAGNDFVAINNMDGHVPEKGRQELIASWCRRGMSIGADGALLVEPARNGDAHFRMRYYNSDGGEAETCGNGSRCIARFAHEQGVAPKQMRFETLAGVYAAEVMDNGQVRVHMTDAFGLRSPVTIAPAAGAPFQGQVHFLNTGVPHVVVLTDDLINLDLVKTGQFLRHHPEFAPAGTNVNFVKVVGPADVEVRTYERGVEAETLACGTGSIASAIISANQGLVTQPVRVKTASGEFLTINFEATSDGARNVTLQGSAEIVFRGYIPTSLTR